MTTGILPRQDLKDADKKPAGDSEGGGGGGRKDIKTQYNASSYFLISAHHETVHCFPDGRGGESHRRRDEETFE